MTAQVWHRKKKYVVVILAGVMGTQSSSCLKRAQEEFVSRGRWMQLAQDRREKAKEAMVILASKGKDPLT